MAWFSKKSKPEPEAKRPTQESPFKAVYFTEADVNVDPSLRQLANEDDESKLRGALAELSDMDRMAVVGCLGLPPITATKVATLSRQLQDPFTADVAGVALWQLLLSDAQPDQLALLERIASPTPSNTDYDVAYGLVSGLMTSSLGRDLKAGEMETARRLVGSFLRLSPDPGQVLQG
jgi:hypothetical protein